MLFARRQKSFSLIVQLVHLDVTRFANGTREKICYEDAVTQLYNLEGSVRWVPCHHSMARPQVADGGNTLQVWRVAANTLNKQSRAADKGWSSSLGVGRGANNSSP
jgi:hypothetical protein